MRVGNFAFERLSIADLILINSKKFIDERGCFSETYSSAVFHQAKINCTFVQDNHSFSHKAGTIRGLHFQLPPNDQAKLVRVLRGSIFDVAVDLRKGGATYAQWCAVTLSAKSNEQLFIPTGFAHGFCTLEPDTEVAYKVDHYYSPATEAGIIWNDPQLQIDWPVQHKEVIVSEKDAKLPPLRDFVSPFAIMKSS